MAKDEGDECFGVNNDGVTPTTDDAGLFDLIAKEPSILAPFSGEECGGQGGREGGRGVDGRERGVERENETRKEGVRGHSRPIAPRQPPLPCHGPLAQRRAPCPTTVPSPSNPSPLAPRLSPVATSLPSGHDHCNDFCCAYNGQHLCFGRHSSYGGYSCSGLAHEHGVRVIEFARSDEGEAGLSTWVRMELGNKAEEHALV